MSPKDVSVSVTNLNLEIEFRNILARGTSNTADDHVRLAEVRDLLKAIEERNVEGAIIRSREQRLEFEKSPLHTFINSKSNARPVIRSMNYASEIRPSRLTKIFSQLAEIFT